MALHEMTNTEFCAKSADKNLLRLITVFQEFFTPTTKTYQSRGEFFGQNRNEKKDPNNIRKQYANWRNIAIWRTLHQQN